jgi:hypothetical protein
LPAVHQDELPTKRDVDFAVNNDGTYFPRVFTSYTSPGTTTAKLIDGNYWYHVHPPNRWTAEGSPNDRDWVAVDFGIPRPIHTIKAYFLDDVDSADPEASPSAKIAAPATFECEYFAGGKWMAVPKQTRRPEKPVGHRANVVHFPELPMEKLRVSFEHTSGRRTGLTELEAWGNASWPVEPAPMPTGNLAYNAGDRPFPKASASYTSRFDKAAELNDGQLNFNPEPRNRWTAYESPNASDWIEIDFGASKKVARVELAIYDDRGGVQAPTSYTIEYWDGANWKEPTGASKLPEQPTGGQFNVAKFDPVETEKVRVKFVHRENARSGISEILVWSD